MPRFRICAIALLAMIFSWAPSTSKATPILFGGNAYEVFVAPNIDWNTANAAAMAAMFMGQPGHLATITSLAEDQFIDGIRITAGGGEFWVGGFQLPGSMEPGAGWTWVNGEGAIAPTNAGPGYANWLGGEPNNVGAAGEDFLAVGLFNQFGWNDEGNLGLISGYIVEWDRVPVPEPSALAIFAIALAGLGFMMRRRRVV